jgi:peptide/nickel transport system ATP-binding protein
MSTGADSGALHHSGDPVAQSPLNGNGNGNGNGNDKPATGEVVLDVRNLRTTFNTPIGVVHAVDGVSFTLERGKTLAIVGESGSGKTVLSRSIMNILPRAGLSRSGNVFFEGRDFFDATDNEIREILGLKVAMIFQDPMTSLHPVMKIGKQITDVLKMHLHMSKAEARARAIELLRSVRIPEPARRLGEYPHQLSGGMRQRVMIAIAIACEPKLLIADEPTTALDVTVQAQILDLLGELQREHQMALILISHDLGVVAGRADDIAVMYAGKIVEKAPTVELFRSTRMPYTRALLDSIPRLDHTVGGRLQVIGGRPPDLRNPPKGCRFAPRCTRAAERCVAEEPPLESIGRPDHLAACWFPIEPSATSLNGDAHAAAGASSPEAVQ